MLEKLMQKNVSKKEKSIAYAALCARVLLLRRILLFFLGGVLCGLCCAASKVVLGVGGVERAIGCFLWLRGFLLAVFLPVLLLQPAQTSLGWMWCILAISRRLLPSEAQRSLSPAFNFRQHNEAIF